MKAELIVNRYYEIGDVDDRLYSSFAEHIGRVVYEGIYEPGHPEADDMGFRQDVIRMVKQLNIPNVRYPGGNFLSVYDWEDGIGPKSERPVKLNSAWNSIETNQVGIDEFQEWAKRAGASVMMGVNLGTRGVEDACNCLEYCNGTSRTHYADLRRKNGFKEPFGIKTWCLGNEMGGIGQPCRKTPEEYGRLAAETAKMMKRIDPEIELVACGSSHRNMPRFGEWELTVLYHTYPFVDFLSIHQYYEKGSRSTEDYLAKSVDMNRYIKSVAAMCDTIREIKGLDKQMNLSFDEWNVLGKGIKQDGKGVYAPPLFECSYTFEDALVVGCMMITLQNNCDRVKIACLAQLVNAIAPFVTEKKGKLWKQTIFAPFFYSSLFGRGKTLLPIVECDCYSTKEHYNIPYLETSVIHRETEKELVVFAVNRSLAESMELEPVFEHFEGCRLIEQIELYSDDLAETNNADKERVMPNIVSAEQSIILKKHSWNMLRFQY
ncbi:MAG: alpha-N-arabinofuranosidase [Ruminococcaceae bacterium]|nr:alpha-N-arabinofuranosidase [Oscillospiraceae bacterium]